MFFYLKTQNCQEHEDEIISWICIEEDCDLRIMCSKCAIINHDQAHRKPIELKSIQESGALKILLQNNLDFQDTLHHHQVVKQFKIDEIFEKIE